MLPAYPYTHVFIDTEDLNYSAPNQADLVSESSNPCSRERNMKIFDGYSGQRLNKCTTGLAAIAGQGEAPVLQRTDRLFKHTLSQREPSGQLHGRNRFCDYDTNQ